MKKKEIVRAVSIKMDEFTQKEIGAVIDTFLDTIMEQVAAGEKVNLFGFGTFEAKDRPERIGRNPRDGSELKIAASRAPKFKAASAFKNALNK